MADTVDITKTHVPIVYVVLIVASIVGGAVAVSKTYNDTAWEVRKLREKVDQMATTADVTAKAESIKSDLREFARERVKFYLEHAAIKTTAVPGKRYQSGKVEFPIHEEE